MILIYDNHNYDEHPIFAKVQNAGNNLKRIMAMFYRFLDLSSMFDSFGWLWLFSYFPAKPVITLK